MERKRYGYGDIITSWGGIIILLVGATCGATIHFSIPKESAFYVYQQHLATLGFLIAYITGLISCHHAANKQPRK